MSIFAERFRLSERKISSVSLRLPVDKERRKPKEEKNFIRCIPAVRSRSSQLGRRICKQQFIERTRSPRGVAVFARSSGIVSLLARGSAAREIRRGRGRSPTRASSLGAQPFFHATSTSNGPVGGPVPPPRPPVARPDILDPGAQAGSCGAFHLTVAFRDGQVRQPRSYLEDTLEEIGPSHGGGFQATMTPS
ncbi:hypothetical protein K0M31_013570 [Melipona bicolor]|uniref:Uncharacterized protein n=1 Tax=Melipona bicolor TaxID=60889 RepID=A0AA40FI99_9HYME|nr:hypothetical protein K0M31_013570 [Melipona bicolor]